MIKHFCYFLKIVLVATIVVTTMAVLSCGSSNQEAEPASPGGELAAPGPLESDTTVAGDVVDITRIFLPDFVHLGDEINSRVEIHNHRVPQRCTVYWDIIFYNEYGEEQLTTRAGEERTRFTQNKSVDVETDSDDYVTWIFPNQTNAGYFDCWIYTNTYDGDPRVESSESKKLTVSVVPTDWPLQPVIEHVYSQSEETQPVILHEDEQESAAIPMRPPTVSTNPETVVTSNGANLIGEVTDMGSASGVAVGFEYGETTSYGNIVEGDPTSRTNPGSFTASITGLTPNTIYHFRAWATIDSSIYHGRDQTFILLAALPPPPVQPVPPPQPPPATTPVIDFAKWTSEPYPAMFDEDYSSPSWDISQDKKGVTESRNCQPVLFYSDFQTMNTSIRVKIKPTTTSEIDDDFIGFALGFQPKDTTNHTASYLLIDWKNSIPGESLNKDFLATGSGGLAKIGLALSHVNGVPTPDEFWQHDDVKDSPKGEGLTELARAKSLGDVGWSFDKEYDFNFDFTETALKIYVNGQLELELTGNFTDGRLAFYNFSQAGVIYSVY
jgi:hypothetical protein